MKKFLIITIAVVGIFAFISCQQDTEIVQKYNPVPVFSVGAYDNSTAEGVLGYMDPIFYQSISVQDSPYVPVLLAGSYVDKLPDERGTTGGKCVKSNKLCLLLAMIPTDFYEFSTMVTTYGYDIYETYYRDILVVAKENEPVMMQGYINNIGYDDENNADNFDMTRIDSQEITFDGKKLVIGGKKNNK
ncbi:MAG: hypothetical protein H8E61_02265 [Bacteroidetes bacterium]|nr:hypothetical protein [Bacteroidota bacterium]